MLGIPHCCPPRGSRAALFTTLEEVHSSHVELPLTSPSLSISAGRTQNRTRRYAIASLLLVTFVSFSYWWVLRKPGSFGDGVMFHSIAVLPFKPIGAESRDEHLGLGMTDATITKLSSLQQFTVRPTSAIFKYTEQDYEALKVGRELGVDAVLEGTVQRVGGGVRVSVQLISIREGKPIWAEKFDERFTDIFIIQDAISAQVAQALRLKLTRDERSRLAKRYTDNLAAYQSYVRGNYFWSKRTEEGIRKAIQYFKQAIDMDTNYALAYAGLGDAYGIVGYYGYENIMKRAEAYEEAKAIATKALRLDEMIPEAHVVLALVKSEHDKDDVGADREYKLALALNPDSALANHRYGVFLLERGRVNEASIVSRKASELDPLSSVICANYCATLYFKREYDAAVKCSNRTFEISPDMPQALLILGLSQGQLGRHEEAIEVLKRFSVSTVVRGDRIESLRSLGYVYALAGQRTAAQNILTELDELSQHNGEALFSKALIYAGLGEMVKVFTVLEKRAPYWTEEPGGLRIDPRYDRIKADPRYAQLLKRHFASL